MENNDLTIAMLDIPGLESKRICLLALLQRTNDFVTSSFTTVGQEEQLSDDWYVMYTNLIDIKRV